MLAHREEVGAEARPLQFLGGRDGRVHELERSARQRDLIRKGAKRLHLLRFERSDAGDVQQHDVRGAGVVAADRRDRVRRKTE